MVAFGNMGGLTSVNVQLSTLGYMQRVHTLSSQASQFAGEDPAVWV